jgi:histidinol phosphatase-like enzyme
MALRLLILNCNNTLRRSIKNPGGHINDPLDQIIIPGAVAALKALDVTWNLVLIHNDGGLTARDPNTKQPFKTRESSIKEQRYTLRLLSGIKSAKAVFLCPNSLGKGSSCWRISSQSVKEFKGTNFRLPNPGMLSLAIAEFANSKTKEILYVDDEETGENAVQAAEEPRLSFKFAEDWWR